MMVMIVMAEQVKMMMLRVAVKETKAGIEGSSREDSQMTEVGTNGAAMKIAAVMCPSTK